MDICITRAFRFQWAVASAIFFFLSTSGADAQPAGAEAVEPTLEWHTSQQCAPGGYDTPSLAFSAIVQGCSSFCMVWNGITQANAGSYAVSGTVYQTCNAQNQVRADPVTQDFALINASKSCSTPGLNYPGYMLSNPGEAPPGFPLGYCYIWLVHHDQTQKPCDTCVGNPIFVGTGNKRQVETDYVGSGGIPLTFRRTYNSAPQYGHAWRSSFDLSVKYQSASGRTTATLVRPEGNYAFTSTGGVWVPDQDVRFKLSGSNGGFQVITPDGDQELYDGYNKVYMSPVWRGHQSIR